MVGYADCGVVWRGGAEGQSGNDAAALRVDLNDGTINKQAEIERARGVRHMADKERLACNIGVAARRIGIGIAGRRIGIPAGSLAWRGKERGGEGAEGTTEGDTEGVQTADYRLLHAVLLLTTYR